MTISEYIKYQKDSQKQVSNENKKIYFGVNIDIDKWTEHLDELAKLPKEFNFLSNFDVLSYLRYHILGVTDPQVYLKVEGSWTGGHEENVRLRAININHG